MATWIALLGGGIGAHRFYLHGFRDPLGWLFMGPCLIGLYGVQRMRRFGVDDHMAWVLIPLLGLTLATTMLTAIVYGLMPDTAWNARFNPVGTQHHTGWATIFGVMAALVLGAGVLMATLAFSAQRYFEYQAEMELLDKRVRLPPPSRRNSVIAPPASAQKPPTGLSLVIF